MRNNKGKRKLGDFTTPYKEVVDDAKLVLCTNWRGLHNMLRRKYPEDTRITLALIRNAYQGRANSAALWLKPLIESLYKPTANDTAGIVSNEAP